MKKLLALVCLLAVGLLVGCGGDKPKPVVKPDPAKLMNDMKAAADDASKTVKDEVEKAKEQIKEGTEKATEEIKEGAEKAKEGVKEAAEKVEGAVKEAAGDKK